MIILCYDAILPICAESAVKPQANKQTNKFAVNIVSLLTRSGFAERCHCLCHTALLNLLTTKKVLLSVFQCNSQLDRRVLTDLAIYEPGTFKVCPII